MIVCKSDESNNEGNLEELVNFKTSNFNIKKDNNKKSNLNYLFNLINHTKTPMGERKLKRWLQMPLVHKKLIHSRQSVIDYFCQNPSVRNSLRESNEKLLRFPDLERLSHKIQIVNTSSGLSDMLSIYRCIFKLKSILSELNDRGRDNMEDFHDLKGNIIDPLDKHILGVAKFNSLVEELIDTDRLNRKDNRLGTKW